MADSLSWIDHLKQRAHTLKIEVYALYLAYGDPRTPLHGKLFAALVVAYAFSPIDLIPDFVPILGYLDDLVLLPLGVVIALKLIPAEVMADSRAKSREIMASGKPVSWVGAVIIGAVWIGLVALGVWLGWRWIRD